MQSTNKTCRDTIGIPEVGDCYRYLEPYDNGLHYYRQDKGRVMHVRVKTNEEGFGWSVMINSLEEEYLHNMRATKFTSITSAEFKEVLDKQLSLI